MTTPDDVMMCLRHMSAEIARLRADNDRLRGAVRVRDGDRWEWYIDNSVEGPHQRCSHCAARKGQPCDDTCPTVTHPEVPRD